MDETRDVSTWRYAASVYNYVLETMPLTRIDCWGGEPPPLITCEARATRGVLEHITGDYLCPITATGGQCGGHIVNEIVPLLRGNERKVLYVGDCEERGPGDQIEANTRRYIQTRVILDRTRLIFVSSIPMGSPLTSITSSTCSDGESSSKPAVRGRAKMTPP